MSEVKSARPVAGWHCHRIKVCARFVALTGMATLGALPFKALAQEAARQTVAATPVAATATGPLYDPPPEFWGRLQHLPPPRYPPGLAARGITGEVDLEVDIDLVGAVKKVRRLAATPHHVEFEESIRAIVPFLSFVVPMSERCIPLDSIAKIKFAFSLDGGQPRVHLEQLAAPREPDSGPRIHDEDMDKFKRDLMQSFPRAARRGGARANVYLMLNVESGSGVVKNVEATHVITAKGFDRIFAKAAEEAARKNRLRAESAVADTSRMCIGIEYRLSKEPETP